MSALSERLRAKRESWITVGEFEFKIRRPTKLEVQKWPKEFHYGDIVMAFVVDWKGVTEKDVFGGDNITPLAFETDLWSEWVSDRQDLWVPLMLKITEQIESYRAEKEEQAKNLNAS